jgi:hypothetical protein
MFCASTLAFRKFCRTFIAKSYTSIWCVLPFLLFPKQLGSMVWRALWYFENLVTPFSKNPVYPQHVVLLCSFRKTRVKARMVCVRWSGHSKLLCIFSKILNTSGICFALLSIQKDDKLPLCSEWAGERGMSPPSYTEEFKTLQSEDDVVVWLVFKNQYATVSWCLRAAGKLANI